MSPWGGYWLEQAMFLELSNSGDVTNTIINAKFAVDIVDFAVIAGDVDKSVNCVWIRRTQNGLRGRVVCQWIPNWLVSATIFCYSIRYAFFRDFRQYDDDAIRSKTRRYFLALHQRCDAFPHWFRLPGSINGDKVVSIESRSLAYNTIVVVFVLLLKFVGINLQPRT